MKILGKLFLIASALASSSIGASKVPTQGIVSIYCSPLYLSGNESLIELSVIGSAKVNNLVEVKIINDTYPTGKLIFKKNYTTVGIEKIKYNNDYTRPSGNTISITTTSNGVTTEYKHEVNVVQDKTYSINEETNNYVADSLYYSWATGSKRWMTGHEKITFYNFEDIYIPDYYHKIDITHFYVRITTSFDTEYLRFGTARFSITNQNGIFNCFQHDKTNAYLPLTFKKSGSNFKLNFDCDLYVDPITLEMSTTKKEGFVKTKYLYLPKDEQRFQETYDCQIALTKLSQDNLKIVSKFKYKSLLNTFGDCRTSEYCIAKK